MIRIRARSPVPRRVVATSAVDASGSASTSHHTAVEPPSSWKPTASSGPPARPPHIDNPNQPLTLPRSPAGARESTHGSAAENSAPSPAPITSLATSTTATFPASR